MRRVTRHSPPQITAHYACWLACGVEWSCVVGSTSERGCVSESVSPRSVALLWAPSWTPRAMSIVGSRIVSSGQQITKNLLFQISGMGVEVQKLSQGQSVELLLLLLSPPPFSFHVVVGPMILLRYVVLLWAPPTPRAS